jgi:hypothetical protein
MRRPFTALSLHRSADPSQQECIGRIHRVCGGLVALITGVEILLAISGLRLIDLTYIIQSSWMGHHQMCAERNRRGPTVLAAVVGVSCLTACTATAPTVSRWQQADASRPAVSSRESGASVLKPKKDSIRVGHRRGIGVATKPNLELSGRASAAQANEPSLAPIHQLSSTTPKVGTSEWEAEQQQSERREQHIKQVIQGICRGC